MSIQTVEIRGERYVLLPEREFLALQRQTAPVERKPTGFAVVVPMRVGGEPASKLLVQDR